MNLIHHSILGALISFTLFSCSPNKHLSTHKTYFQDFKDEANILENKALKKRLSEFAKDFENHKWREVVSYFSLYHVTMQFCMYMEDNDKSETPKSIQQLRNHYIGETVGLYFVNTKLKDINKVERFSYINSAKFDNDLYEVHFEVSFNGVTEQGSFFINISDLMFSGPFG